VNRCSDSSDVSDVSFRRSNCDGSFQLCPDNSNRVVVGLWPVTLKDMTEGPDRDQISDRTEIEIENLEETFRKVQGRQRTFSIAVKLCNFVVLATFSMLGLSGMQRFLPKFMINSDFLGLYAGCSRFCS
jgi:hypothetical protein